MEMGMEMEVDARAGAGAVQEQFRVKLSRDMTCRSGGDRKIDMYLTAATNERPFSTIASLIESVFDEISLSPSLSVCLSRSEASPVQGIRYSGTAKGIFSVCIMLKNDQAKTWARFTVDMNVRIIWRRQVTGPTYHAVVTYP